MLRFGYAQTLETFEEVVDQLPMRLLVSLGNAAEIYFDEDAHLFDHFVSELL